MSKRDYYEVLGVDKGASDQEIKKNTMNMLQILMGPQMEISIQDLYLELNMQKSQLTLS